MRMLPNKRLHGTAVAYMDAPAAFPPGHPTDRHRNRPATWTQRHQMVLQLHLAGWRTKDIARRVGYASGRVSTIVNSPLFQAQKAKLLAEMRGTTLDELLEVIRREAIPNLRFLIAMRDDPTHHGGDSRIRLRAAKAIADLLERYCPDARRAPNG